MKEVCLVYMASGSYDSYSNDVILAFETLEEGEKAIEQIEAELKEIWKIPEPMDAFRNLEREERVEGAFERLKNEYVEKVRAIVKVLPVNYSEHDGVQYVGGIPDYRDRQNNELDFSAVMMPVSKLVDMLTSSAKQEG
jgi:hypothetical protein